MSPDANAVTSSDIVLYLSPKQPPPLLPFELQKFISPDAWASRVPAIIRVASKYSNPSLERLWLILGLIASVVIPAAVYAPILNALDAKDPDDLDNVRFETRAIALSIFVGTLLVIFIPMIIWKAVGDIRIRGMLKRWSMVDARLSSTFTPIPKWTVRIPGVFANSITLLIAVPVVPAPPPPSYFNHDASLPPYINPPTDGPEHGKPKDYLGLELGGDGKFGDIPLYSDEKYSMA